MEFRIEYCAAPDGWYITRCPTMPGCVGQGKTLDDAVSDIRSIIKAMKAAQAKFYADQAELIESENGVTIELVKA